MSQKLSVNCFKWVENTSQFNENFIKSYNDASDAGYFLEVDVQYSEKIHNLHNDLFFLPERMKIEKVQKHVANLHDKKKICHAHTKFKTLTKSLISIEKTT